MPHIKIPRVGVVTFHRTRTAKAKAGTPKDAVLANLGPPNIPLSERLKKPVVELRRWSPYTQYPTVKAVNDAIERLPGRGLAEWIVDDISASLRSRTQTGAPPQVAILGESHGKVASLAMAMTALHELSRVPGQKTLLLEYEPTALDTAGLTDKNHWVVKAFNSSIAAGRQPQIEELHGGPVPSAVAGLWVTAAVAHSLGFDVRGFDLHHTGAPNRDIREQAMLQEVQRSVASSSTTLVITGAAHVAALHEPLSSQYGTWTCAVMSPLEDGNTVIAKRLSYLLAKRDQIELVSPRGANVSRDFVAADVPGLFLRARNRAS